ncbi:MAG: radical SAM protein [Prevotella sp.]|nr:radical SAM protein [Prevotella sp.]
MQSAPIIGLGRHRLSVDGKGVTTLVAFHGCTLHCHYCLNSSCLMPGGVWREVTTEELLEEVRIDNLYFVATGGGITFGGGEPCLRSLFIEEFAGMMPQEWNITIETCLNVERQHVERLLPIVSQWIIDVKDMNREIYKAYTGKSNKRTIDNLRWLLRHEGMAERIILRLPHIPEYNTNENVKQSRRLLKDMGIKTFDEFDYIVKAPS